MLLVGKVCKENRMNTSLQVYNFHDGAKINQSAARRT